MIDLSDNDIKKVDNVPVMNRLNSLLLCNNSITRISPTIGDYLPRLQALILTNNKLQAMYEIDHIATLKQLEVLSFLENPITLQPHYRAYIIHKIPQLKTLDFVKISRTEREEVKTLFSSSVGKLFLSNIQQEKAMYTNSLDQKKQTNGTGKPAAAPGTKAVAMSLTEDQRRQVKEAIEAANTKEDIDLIEYQLKVRSSRHFSFLPDLLVVILAFSSFLSLPRLVHSNSKLHQKTLVIMIRVIMAVQTMKGQQIKGHIKKSHTMTSMSLIKDCFLPLQNRITLLSQIAWL